MFVRARFYGDIKDHLKKRWMMLEIPEGSSVRFFILRLVKICDSSFMELFFAENDKIRSDVTILLNGRNIMHLEGLNTELKDRDLICIMPVVCGG